MKMIVGSVRETDMSLHTCTYRINVSFLPLESQFPRRKETPTQTSVPLRGSRSVCRHENAVRKAVLLYHSNCMACHVMSVKECSMVYLAA